MGGTNPADTIIFLEPWTDPGSTIQNCDAAYSTWLKKMGLRKGMAIGKAQNILASRFETTVSKNKDTNGGLLGHVKSGFLIFVGYLISHH